MTEERLEGTQINPEKAADEFAEVEKLIQETLQESKAAQAKEKPKAEPQKEVKSPETKPTPIAKPTPPPTTYEATFKEYKVDDIVKGTVVKVEQKGVLVDIKYKADGLIASDELSDRHFNTPADVVKVGDVIDVYIKQLENKEGYVVLSKSRADAQLRWKKAYDAFRAKQFLQGKVVQALRGGLMVDCNGIRGFVPASQVSKKPGETLDNFKDKTISVKIIEINRHQGKIVFSNRLAAGEKEQLQSQKIFEELEIGQVRKGKVTKLKTFGAFVDLGGIEGLLHLSELSWKRVKNPSEVLKAGQEIEVLILGVDKASKKVSLGRKELLPDPWENATEYYKAGQIVKAKIMRFAKFGAFAELDHDLEGLIHNTELCKETVYNPADSGVKIGDTVDVKILRVLPEEQKIGLSIKQILQDKEKQELKTVNTAPDEPKVTIADMISQKEKERTEEEPDSE